MTPAATGCPTSETVVIWSNSDHERWVTTVPSRGMTLGEYLERARAAAGLSIRQLEAATGIPRSTIAHLLKDRVRRPDIRHLTKLARALGANPADLFVLVGFPASPTLPGLEAVLRAEYALPDEGIAEIIRYIDVIVDKYRKHDSHYDEMMKGETDG